MASNLPSCLWTAINTITRVVLVSVSFAVLLTSSRAAEDEFVIKYQYASPPGTNWTTFGSEPLAEFISDATKGRAEVRTFPAGSLSSFSDLLRSTSSGIVDMAELWLPALPGKFPLMELFALPGLSHGQAVSNAVYLEMVEKYPSLGEKFTEADNVVELASMITMRAELHTLEPVRSLDDLRGKVMACQDESAVEVLKLLGASCTVTVGGDAYLAAQRGVVDGVMAAWGWVNAFKIYEVTRYHTLLGLSPGAVTIVMNKDVYDKLSDDEKFIIDSLRHNVPIGFVRANVTNVADIFQTKVDPENIFQISADDRAALRESLHPIWDRWVEKVTELGYPGQAMLDDAVRLMDLYAAN